MSSIITELLNKLLVEFKKEKNMTRIQKEVVDPIIHYSFKQMYPYILVTLILFCLTFILALLILLLLLKNNKYTNSLS
mgnify:FL=1|jgi:hypothetical protein|uniref:Uncharacterized protein n=1 Tax=viral metagenome TaxID=1070528 RepID=A0A6C0LXQ4_9ZZZZ